MEDSEQGNADKKRGRNQPEHFSDEYSPEVDRFPPVFFVRIVNFSLSHLKLLFVLAVLGLLVGTALLHGAPKTLAKDLCSVLLSLFAALLAGWIISCAAFSRALKVTEERLVEKGAASSALKQFDSKNISGIIELDRLCLALGGGKEHLDHLEYELTELRERHELITANIAASVIIQDAFGKILFCSPYTQVLTGYSAAEIQVQSEKGKDFMEGILDEKDIDRYRRARQVSQLGEDILVRYRINHRSGLRLWLETRMVPVCDDDGEVTSVMSATIDVTESLSYQEQIEEQNRDLNDFAYMVSHDLKAPIFTIKGMTSALLEDYGEQLGNDGAELLNYILDGANRLEKLVASVIEYSALTKKEMEESDVDLNVVAANVRADLSELIRNKNAEISAQPDLPTIRGDQIRIYQIFSNLLGNALKYSSADRTPKISIAARRPTSDQVVIDVQDNGMGIPQAKLEDIFRPYRRAHGNEIEGSGIGLACVKKIVDQLGGSVSVRSTENEGSTFSVIFPAAKPNPRMIPEDLARLF